MERISERIPVMVEPSLLEKIDDIRFSRRMPSRSEAVRQLIHKGLEASREQAAEL